MVVVSLCCEVLRYIRINRLNPDLALETAVIGARFKAGRPRPRPLLSAQGKIFCRMDVLSFFCLVYFLFVIRFLTARTTRKIVFSVNFV